MSGHIPVDPDSQANTQDDGSLHEITPDIAYQRLAIANVAYVGEAGAASGQWVLIDAGVPGTERLIRHAVERRFGEDSRPAAIVLTHGHFDHVGALESLAERWDVPIYAHEQEMPYLNGSTSYPEPDPGVGGGMMSTLSRFYPSGPVDVGRWLQPLPSDGSVPAMPGWRWIHTPGHTAGHISLWRESDRTLIVGDAFVTTNQESIHAVGTQKPELHGPPMYFTTDWDAAKASVQQLAERQPEVVISGHGPPLQGSEMREALDRLAREFDAIAVPEKGRYVDNE